MELKDAKQQVEEQLGRFRGIEILSTEALNEIENITNALILSWAQKKFFVVDPQKRIINGIRLWFCEHSGMLKTRFRY